MRPFAARLLFAVAYALAAFVALWVTASPAISAQRVGHVEVELIAEHLQLQPGRDNTVALRLLPDPGWHVYWRNPGDSGLATTLQWTLPSGARAGDIQWPYPQAHKVGTLVNYGFDHEVLHLVPVTIDAALVGRTVPLQADANWLVCADVCIPGSATLKLDLPVSNAPRQASAAHAKAFAETRAALPQTLAAEAKFAIDAAQLTLTFTQPDLRDAMRIEFFPYASELVTHAAAQNVQFENDRLTLTQPRSPYFTTTPDTMSGVIVAHRADGVRAYEVNATLDASVAAPVAASVASAEVVAPIVATPAAAAAGSTSFLLVLLSALMGGLILNLMPCVFPVLSIKAMALMQSGDHAPQARQRHALVYTSGVLVAFATIAGLLLVLRAGGAALGWGFQLQSPVVVALLAYLMFTLGLSMSGVIEFGGRWMGIGQQLVGKQGLSGTFFTGVLAVVIASPCTAPFMGAALGYALVQPPLQALAVFLALGLGLALPFLLLGFMPRLARLLPKPGAWMQTFRQLMAFPLYLTVVWLLWVLMRQAGANAAAITLLGLVILAFALWCFRFARFGRGGAIIALLLATGLLAHPLVRNGTPAMQAAQSTGQGWEPYSDARLAALHAEGKTVFVNFTADWCITCKVNEGSSLNNGTVEAAFVRQNVALLRGDWTRADPAITAALARHNRSGVPLYLLARPGVEPVVLPQILTPGLVIEALQTP